MHTSCIFVSAVNDIVALETKQDWQTTVYNVSQSHLICSDKIYIAADKSIDLKENKSLLF